jgi:hypothetical protein
MGWTFRRSVNLGPFRVNISRSGIGYSLGAGGFRTGVTSRGRRYRSFALGGTGIRYRSQGGSAGCCVVLAAVLVAGAAALWHVLA